MAPTPDDATIASDSCIDLAVRCAADAKTAVTMGERIALVADAQAALSEALLHLRPHAAPGVKDPVAAVAVTTDVLHQVAWSEADPHDEPLPATPASRSGTVHPIRPPR